MPRTRSLAWAELKIGIVALLALVITTVFIFLLSGEGGFFWQRYAIKTVFANVAGLKEGAPVRVAGVEVGSVTDVQFMGDRVEVTMEVGEEHQPRITTRSLATLGSVSLLGESAIDVTADSQGTPIPEWGYVRSGPMPPSINDVASRANEGIQGITTLLADLRAGKGTAGQLLTNDELYREITTLVSTAEGVARSLNTGLTTGRGTIGQLFTDPAAAQSLEASMQNLERITAGIRAGEGSLGKLLTDDALSRSLNATAANADSITARINNGEGTMGKLITERELYDRLNSMTMRVDQVMATLQAGEGTAGRLLQDRRLYENMTGAVTELQRLIAAIRADPKRYLNVKVSLF
jgi:phospholipid/cholesterol/gamma-HCH transport system substrate-binding protein